MYIDEATGVVLLCRECAPVPALTLASDRAFDFTAPEPHSDTAPFALSVTVPVPVLAVTRSAIEIVPRLEERRVGREWSSAGARARRGAEGVGADSGSVQGGRRARV